jgi:hypothetical protein
MNTEQAKPFTKADLKDGMSITCRKGAKYNIKGGEAYHIQGGYIALQNFNDDLTMIDRKYRDYDIISVEQPVIVFNRDNEDQLRKERIGSQLSLMKAKQQRLSAHMKILEDKLTLL